MMQFKYTILTYKQSVRFVFDKSKSLVNTGCILHTDLSHWKWLLKPSMNGKNVNLFVEKLNGYERFNHKLLTSFCVYSINTLQVDDTGEESVNNSGKVILFDNIISLWSGGNSSNYTNITLPTNGEIFVSITEYLVQRQTFLNNTLIESVLINPTKCVKLKKLKLETTIISSPSCPSHPPKSQSIEIKNSHSTKPLFKGRLKNLNHLTTNTMRSKHVCDRPILTDCNTVDHIEPTCSIAAVNQYMLRLKSYLVPKVDELVIKNNAEQIICVLHTEPQELSVLITTSFTIKMAQITDMENKLSALVTRIKVLLKKRDDLPSAPNGPITVRLNLTTLTDTLTQLPVPSSNSSEFYKGDAATLASFLAYLNEIQSERRAEYETMVGQSQTSKRSMDELNRNIDQSLRQIESLSVQHRDALIKQTAEHNEVAAQRKEVDRMAEQLQDMQERLGILEGENKQFEQLANAFEQEPSMSIKHFRVYQEYRNLSEKIRQNRHRLDAARINLKKTTTQMTQNENMVEQLKEAVDRAKQEHTSLAEQSNELTKKLGTFDVSLRQQEYDFKIFDQLMGNTQKLLSLYEAYDRMNNEYKLIANAYQTNYSELCSITLPNTTEVNLDYQTFKDNVDVRNEQIVMITSQMAHYRAELSQLMETRSQLIKNLTEFDTKYQLLTNKIASLLDEKERISENYQRLQCEVAQITRIKSLPYNNKPTTTDIKTMDQIQMEIYNVSRGITQYLNQFSSYTNDREVLSRDDCTLYQNYIRYKTKYESLDSTRNILEAKIIEANSLYTHIESILPHLVTRFNELLCSHEVIEKQLETLIYTIQQQVYDMNVRNQQLHTHVINMGHSLPLTRDIVSLKLHRISNAYVHEPFEVVVEPSPFEVCERPIPEPVPDVVEESNEDTNMEVDSTPYEKPETGYM